MSLVTSIAGEFNDLHLLSTNSIGASSPNNGFINNPEFTFREEVGFEYKVGIADNYIKVNESIYSVGSENIDFTGTLPDVTIVTDSNGVTANKGDYFIDDNEILSQESSQYVATNGASVSDNSENVRLTNGTSLRGFANQPISTIIGKRYSGYIELVGGTASASAKAYFGSTNGASNLFLSPAGIGRYFYSFVATTPTTFFTLDNTTATTSAYTDFRISVKAVNNLKQASRDIADMLDYSLELGKQLTVKDREVVFADGSIFPVLSSGEGFYQNIKGTSIAFTPSSLTSIGAPSWRYLGTASEMSLQNPYFVGREAITNQVLAYIEEAADNTISTKTEVLMELSYAVETPIQVLTKNGFTHLGKGLFSKDGLNIIPIGIWQTKNDGAYHPAYNVMGTSAFTNNVEASGSWKYWYDSLSYDATSIADAFSKTTDVTSRRGSIDSSFGMRPDEKFYDSVYENDFIPMYNLVSQTSNTELSDRFFNDAIGNKLSGVNNMTAISIRTDATIYNSSGWIIPTKFFGERDILIGEVLKVFTLEGSIFDVTVTNNYINGNIRVSTDVTAYSGQHVIAMYNSSNKNILTQELPILSRGTQTRIDVVGSPTNYPQDWRNELLKGKSLLFNPLLVGQDGTDYTLINGVNSIDFIASRKALTNYQHVLTLDEGISWNISSLSFVGVSNSTGSVIFQNKRVQIGSYEAINDIILQSDPKTITTVNSKIVASNAHTSHIVNACLGKVAVGNLANGLESKALENTLLGVKKIINVGVEVSVKIGEIVKVGLRHTDAGRIYKRLNSDATFTSAGGTLFSPNWEKIDRYSEIITTPKHNTFTLNNAVSPTCKYFVAIAEQDGYKYGMVYAKEMIWDTDKDAFSDFANVSETDSLDNQFATSTLVNITNGRFPGKYRMLRDLSAVSLNHANFTKVDGDIYWAQINDASKYFESWDGTGFGDNGEFDQLTNGSQVDKNGNVVTTFVGAFRLNELGN